MSYVLGSGLTKSELVSHLREARYRTDELFQMVRPDALYSRPIAERHRIVFYLGHLEAFDWNLICAGQGLQSSSREFDQLFAFGIDPTGSALPQDQPEDWPGENEIHAYNRRVREAVDQCLVDQCLSGSTDYQIFWAAIEHRLMHAETLAYMLHWLPGEVKRPDLVPLEAECKEPAFRQVDIPQGIATLGISDTDAAPFGWDNEFRALRVEVPAFSIDQYKVTNGQYEEFVRAGGYDDRRFWSEAAWNWIQQSGICHPKFWQPHRSGWLYRSMFGDIPFPSSWPAYVSHAEAEAYARWKAKHLPTEAQFHRAAYGTASGFERQYPWGNTSPQPAHGNFNFARWNPSPVDAYPFERSAFGVEGMVGNGWEWTSSIFEPLPGFEPFSFYPGYSANFFDGKHFVLKGGSPRTSSLLLRRSFRNWFQPHYQNIYASFRCIES